MAATRAEPGPDCETSVRRSLARVLQHSSHAGNPVPCTRMGSEGMKELLHYIWKISRGSDFDLEEGSYREYSAKLINRGIEDTDQAEFDSIAESAESSLKADVA